MPRKTLTEKQENSICAQHAMGVPQTQIAFHIGCSTRTVGRVLAARGVATAVPRLQDEARDVMKLLKKHDINPKELHLILQDYKSGQKTMNFGDPVMTQEAMEERINRELELDKKAIQNYLNNCDHAELATLFYRAALNKVIQTHIKHAAAVKKDFAETQTKKEEPVNYGHQRTLHYPSYTLK